jgi:hypothetical protein
MPADEHAHVRDGGIAQPRGDFEKWLLIARPGVPPSARFLRHVIALINFLDQVGHGSRTGEISDLLVLCWLFQAEMFADQAEHLHGLRDFLFCQHANLQIQMCPSLLPS